MDMFLIGLYVTYFQSESVYSSGGIMFSFIATKRQHYLHHL